MKKTKKLVALLLAVICVVSMFSFTGVSASAANYTSDYSKYSTPSASDYAYWNGKKVVKASGTTKSEIKWMQAALNYCITDKGLNASKLDVDGSFGPASKKTATAFQKKYGLSADGSFGPKTIAKMKDVLKQVSSSKGKSQQTVDFIWPIANGKGHVSHKAGEKRSSHIHAGTDIGAASGTNVLAVSAGTVKAAGWNNARGWYVTILHGKYLCVYQHLKSKSPVKKGDKVSQGQVVGKVGNTGTSFGAHLHFEMALYSSLKKTGSITNYLYNDIQKKKKPTYYSVSRGNKVGSYYSLNFSKVKN